MKDGIIIQQKLIISLLNCQSCSEGNTCVGPLVAGFVSQRQGEQSEQVSRRFVLVVT